jgi:membrane protease YdiL (CAAX protease family)
MKMNLVPLLRRVWQVARELLLAALLIVGTALAFRFLLYPAVLWAFDPGPAVATQVKRLGILVFATLGYWLYVRYVRRRPVTELRPAPVGTALGALAGAGLIGLALLPLFAFGAYAVTTQRGFQVGLLEIAGFLFVAAMLEELVYRGVLFQSLESAWGTVPALWLQSLAFGVGHLENVFALDGSGWDMAATVLSVTLLGAMWTLLFVLTRNLWICGLNHFAWNFTILCSGVPLSGIEDWRAQAPIETAYRAPDWITGGLFGPENAVVTLVLVALAVGGLWRWAAKRGMFRLATPLPEAAAPVA